MQSRCPVQVPVGYHADALERHCPCEARFFAGDPREPYPAAGIRHTVVGWSNDCELLEILMPAEHETFND